MKKNRGQVLIFEVIILPILLKQYNEAGKVLKIEEVAKHEWEFGGDDEAFYYWERSGILWEDPEVKQWLIQNAGKGKRPR